MEHDDFTQYHQTYKLYNAIKEYYSSPVSIGDERPKITNETPFTIVAVYVNLCVKKFYRKPKYKVIQLSLRYLDEIGYKYQ